MEQIWNESVMPLWKAQVLSVLPPNVLEMTQKFDALVIDKVGEVATVYNPTAVITVLIVTFIVMKVLSGMYTIIVGRNIDCHRLVTY